MSFWRIGKKLRMVGKEKSMSKLQTDKIQSKKETSGIWVLLIFVILIAIVVIVAVTSQ